MTKSRPGSIFSSVSKSYNPYKSPNKEPQPENVCVHSVNTKQKIEWSYDNEEIIAEWCDIAQCYKWLNYHSHNYYYRLHAWFTIPAITFSTISGTASFASASIPREYQQFAPMVIGTINIFIGILTTVQQYLKVSELKEAHRIASISWDKYARNISIELSKTPLERIDAATFLKFSRQEFDRLMESNPSIPIHIIRNFKEAFRGKNHEERKHFDLIKKPDICDVIVSINEKRHMWFPKRENLLLSLSPPDDTSVSVEDIETGSSSTIQYHTRKENLTSPVSLTGRVRSSSVNNRRNNSNSNNSVFSQENLMKHNSGLNHHTHNTSNNGSIDKSVSRSSFINYSRHYNKDVTDGSMNINKVGNPGDSSKDADIPSLREFVSSLNIVNSSPFSVLPTPRPNTDRLLGTESPKKRFSFLSNNPRPEDITMRSPQCVVNSTSVTSQDESRMRMSQVTRPSTKRRSHNNSKNITPRSSSSSMAEYPEKNEMDKSHRNRKSKSNTFISTTKESDTNMIKTVDAESNIESSSGKSNTSIIQEIPKKTILHKKKVRHEGYANTSDSEVCDIDNISFTIDTLQREFAWSDSEDENVDRRSPCGQDNTAHYVTVPYMSVPSVTVPFVSSSSMSIPFISVPSISVPSISVPSISVPSISVPSISVPSISVPSISVPSISVPTESTDTDTPISSQTVSCDVEDNK
jgi:hypothetical protein